MSTAVPIVTETKPVTNGLPSQLRRPGGAIVQWSLTLIAVGFLSLFILWPVANVFRNAFSLEWSDFRFWPTAQVVDGAESPSASDNVRALPAKVSDGWRKYVRAFYVPAVDPQTLPRAERRQYLKDSSSAEANIQSIRMTLTTLVFVVPMNVVFGLMAAWAVTKFSFKGKTLLVSLIDLPFSVSPVVAGMIFVLLFGRVGVFGDWATHFNWPWPWSAYWRGFDGHWFPVAFSDWKQGVIFTPLATTLASAFVTFPFVARALIPLMESQGTESEQAAITLGASGWQTYRRVTLPAIKWGLLYGVILCSARAVGEFGAVSVVSGGVAENDTMPLRVQKIWDGYNQQQAFALASLLASVSILTLLLKVLIDRKQGQTAKKPRAGH